MNKDSRIYPDLSYKILNKHQKSLTFTHTNKGTSYLYTTFLYIKKKNPEIISNQGEASLFLINSHWLIGSLNNLKANMSGMEAFQHSKKIDLNYL